MGAVEQAKNERTGAFGVFQGEVGFRTLSTSAMALLAAAAVACTALVFLVMRDKAAYPHQLFSTGVDALGAWVCIVLFYGCVAGSGKEPERSTKAFMQMIFLNSLAFLLNELAWHFEGVPGLRIPNLAANTLLNSIDITMIVCFWRYVRTTLSLDEVLPDWTDKAVRILFVPAQILVLSNLVAPFCFGVNDMGIFYHSDLYWLTDLYLFFVMGLSIVGLVRSPAVLHEKVIASSFIGIPILHYVITQDITGLASQYGATLVAIILIYSVIFSERGKRLVSTQTELGTAMEIQTGMLPNMFPAFPERVEFDLFASMDPAKEVGGDFYDFFLVDDDHLAIVMADVSGKGIPAALFMMASKIMINNRALMGGSPAEVLEAVNDSICANNDAGMFVTVWLGILELSTGKLVAANAGHELPALKRADGTFELVETKHGFVVGGLEGMAYKDVELTLGRGDMLFLYTDGVAEAQNAEGELFGTERMIDALNAGGAHDVYGVLETMSQAVDAFVDRAPQFDDLTMLCVEYKGPAA